MHCKKWARITAAGAALLMAVGMSLPADAASAYDSYSYDYWGNVVEGPAPFTPYQVLSGTDMDAEIGALKDPSDMCVGFDRIYIADSGNNRILVLREDFTLEYIISEVPIEPPVTETEPDSDTESEESTESAPESDTESAPESEESAESTPDAEGGAEAVPAAAEENVDSAPADDTTTEGDTDTAPEGGETTEGDTDAAPEDGENAEGDADAAPEEGEDAEEEVITGPYAPTLNNPQGIFVTEDGHLYIADTDNSRVLEYDENGTFVRMIDKPKTDLLSASFTYKPMKLAVDDAGRIYITAYGVNLGIIELSSDGNFQSFIGAIEVTVNWTEYIWKKYFTTEAQASSMTLSVPTEYSNIFLDDKQFIYGTISTLSDEDIASGADVVRRLNPTGVDVLRRLGNMPVSGDAGATAETSKFDDIAATSYGTYFVLDSAQGKVFTYDFDGNLMFVFGRKGNRWGNVQTPVALCALQDGRRLMVLDKATATVVVYDATQYGESILHALDMSFTGNMATAYEAWQEVLKLNANNEYAYIGAGRYYLQEGDYTTAMEYFESVNNRTYYSKAMKLYRKDLMTEHFGNYIMVIIVAVVLVFIWAAYRRLRNKVRDFVCR